MAFITLSRETGRGCLVWNLRGRLSPITSIDALSLATELTPTTTAASLAKLTNIGVAKEITGAKYGRLYTYDGYLKILAPGE